LNRVLSLIEISRYTLLLKLKGFRLTAGHHPVAVNQPLVSLSYKSTLINYLMSTVVLLNKVKLITLKLASNYKTTELISALTINTILADVHIQLHLVLLTVLHIKACPFLGIKEDLKTPLTVAWD
jgi:hypothetical protein